jgi:hypothetical protein
VTTIRGQLVVHTDLTRLKATGFSGYEQTIWPLSMARFDLLSVHVSNPTEIYLHSERDMYPRLPAFSAVGRYKLVYEILAEHFPHLEFAVELAVTGDVNTTTASLTTV